MWPPKGHEGCWVQGMVTKLTARVAWLTAVLLLGCPASGPGPGLGSRGITAETHTFFPVSGAATHAVGAQTIDGPITCESCHPTQAVSFKDISCTGCHAHDAQTTDLLHRSQPDYRYDSRACFTCHPTSEKIPFSHTGIGVGTCAGCHDVNKTFAALPVPGFTHPSMSGADCGACHTPSGWKGAANGTLDVFDPLTSLRIEALIPRYQGTSISLLTPQTQILPMPMKHQTTQVVAAALGACTNCHPDSAQGTYYPGKLHGSLEALGLSQPSQCSDCHSMSVPRGFVGPLATAPLRIPSSGEMKHDAVSWSAGSPTQQLLVSAECGTCHQPGAANGWATANDGSTPAKYHASLTAKALPQPSSCVDCHANSRPLGVLSAPQAALPAQVTFDHQHPDALGDCQTCHAGSAPGFTSFAQGKFHLPGSPNPTSCVACHAGERPTSTATWASTTYTKSPFDYVTNSLGITHGAGQDCVVCHAGPGTGQWGSTQNWLNGHFEHGPNTLSARSCINCHTTQRPDRLPGATAQDMATLLGFDHAQNGTGDCYGCHQATVTAGKYVDLFNPTTGMLPNGDWKGGQDYPGSTLVSSQTSFIKVDELLLNRSGPHNLVTGISSRTSTYYNAMLHTAAAVPPALNAGPTGQPDYATCWHCHTHTNGTVTAYSGGVFHASLTQYRATVGGPVTPLPQPTSGCVQCHDPQMRPNGIVQRAASNLRPMDHDAAFVTPVNIGGTMAGNANGLDCAVCHKSTAGSTTWADGEFHANVGVAVPSDCTVCHYPLMADAVKADLTQGTTFAMKHRSGVLTFQKCDTCHGGALAKGSTAPPTAALWQPGAYHGSLSAQPQACVDCHAVSDPVMSTASLETYTLAVGGTATNGTQWMSHASPQVAGRDCASCHLSDAKKTGSAWSHSTRFHPAVTSATSCQECHGTANGQGTVPGTRNNLPSGLTPTATVSTIAGVSGSGVAAGTRDQMNHADLNVTGHDCNFCHTQQGSATAAPAAGKEWAQAKFHPNFGGGATALLMNGTTGRCSNCHLNVKPAAGYSPQDHSAFTNVSGSQDCAACHSLPGTGTVGAPNWKGASGVPPFISVGGFNVSVPPAASGTVQGGISNLPHPTVASGMSCTACHASSSGGRRAIGYDHASALINANCKACHEAGSDLVGTPWNRTVAATNLPANCGEGGGSVRDREGDTRAIGLTTLACSDKASTKSCGSASCAQNHFYPADCYECHVKPTGLSVTRTGQSYVTGWRFPHNRNAMQPATCCMCHEAKAGGCRP